MPRRADIRQFYRLITRLEHNTCGRRALGQIRQADCPDRGVYFFFEEGEERSGSGAGDRIVRVGSHALRPGQRATLWNRMAMHKGSRRPRVRQRGSVFRNRVGNAVCLRNRRLGPQNWPRDARLGDAARIERLINRHMWPMTALLLPVGRRPHRGRIERNAIALLSEYGEADPIDPASDDWLGHHCNRERVRGSGLWQSNHVADPYDPDFLDLLEEYVDRTAD